MNKRIKELHADLWNNIYIKLEPTVGHRDNGWAWSREYQQEVFDAGMQKFAELIIKDCINIIRQEWFSENNTIPEQDARSIAIHVGKKLGIDSALNAVTNHFRVEE